MSNTKCVINLGQMWERACSGRRSDEEALPSTIYLILPERSRYFVRPFLKVIADTLSLI